MKFSSVRIIFILVICTGLIGIENAACGHLPTSEAEKYRVTFGESYIDFLPGSLIRMEVIFKNNVSKNIQVSQELVVLDSTKNKVWKTIINLSLAPEDSSTIQFMVPVPKVPGCYTLTLGKTANQGFLSIPKRIFNAIQPTKSPRLEKILVHTPDSEAELNAFLKTWTIKAPAFSWAQVLLLGKTSWRLFTTGDQQITQLINRALRREMSVIFLDFGPAEDKSDFVLPFDISVRFVPFSSPEKNFILKSGFHELNYGLTTGRIDKWNGFEGITVPAEEMKFEGKGVKIVALATTNGNTVRFPLVEINPQYGKGKLYLCQLITDGRLDQDIQPPRYKPGVPAYDPMSVQFLLNLISASVGDNLLK